MPDRPQTSQYPPYAGTAAEALALRVHGTARLHLHRNRLHVRILLQTVLAEFPADSGLLETTERRPYRFATANLRGRGSTPSVGRRKLSRIGEQGLLSCVG